MSESSPLRHHDWFLAFLAALAVVLLTLLPYGLGHLLPQEGFAFTGTIMNPEDSQTYFAKMFQGYNGRWLYTIPFTPEAHPGAFVGVFYVWLGQLARLLGLSLMGMWHGARVVADLILFLVVFGFVGVFLPDRRARWTAYLLALSGSGLGWLLFLINQPYWLDAFPVDFKQPGAHLFFTAFTFPHVALGTAFTILSMGVLWRLGQGAGRWRWAVFGGVIHVALGIAYPFLIYLVALVSGLYWVYLSVQARQVLWQKGFLFALLFVIPAPLYLYYAYTLQINPVFKAWDVQAVTLSAPWPHYLVAYGVMLGMGLLHWRAKPTQRPHFALLWLWVLAVALLLYAPLNPQRRFVQGVHLPLAIVTTAGFWAVIWPWLQQTRPFQAVLAHPRYSMAGLARLSGVIFLAFMSLSNWYVLASVTTSALIQQPDPLFRPVEELAAAAWLAENGQETAVLMGDYQTGNYVAAHTPQRVILGHWAETVDFGQKEREVAQFYAGETTESWRRGLINLYDITYIWYGPRERQLGDFDPETADYLHSIYANETITIYLVDSE